LAIRNFAIWAICHLAIEDQVAEDAGVGNLTAEARSSFEIVIPSEAGVREAEDGESRDKAFGFAFVFEETALRQTNGKGIVPRLRNRSPAKPGLVLRSG
jgi:hypothetical protein